MFNVYGIEKHKPCLRTQAPTDAQKRAATLRELGRLVQAKMNARRIPAISDTTNATWREWLRLSKQFEAVAAMEDFPCDFSELTVAEQRASRLAVSEAAFEHFERTPALCRILGGAHFHKANEQAAFFDVPSESRLGICRRVRIGLAPCVDDSCDCPDTTRRCWHILASAQQARDLGLLPGPADVVTDDALDVMEAEERAPRRELPVKPGHEPDFGRALERINNPAQPVVNYLEVFGE